MATRAASPQLELPLMQEVHEALGDAIITNVPLDEEPLGQIVEGVLCSR